MRKVVGFLLFAVGVAVVLAIVTRVPAIRGLVLNAA